MTSITYHDMPGNTPVASNAEITADKSNPRRRVMVFINGTSVSGIQAEDLRWWIPNLTDIEGVVMSTVDDRETATAVTWSGTTLTYANHTGSGVQELCLIGRML